MTKRFSCPDYFLGRVIFWLGGLCRIFSHFSNKTRNDRGNHVSQFSEYYGRWIVTLVLFVSLAPAAWSFPGEWTVVIDTKLLDRCLRYPGSRLAPIIKASINFKQPTREETAQPTIYEDVYYSHCHVIGLRRHHALDIRPGTQGVIYVSGSSSNLRAEEACAAANALVRVFLDLYVKKAPLRFVIVSREFFDMLIAGLQRYGFRPAIVSADQPVIALVMLHIKSDPPGRTQDLLYGN